MKSNNEYDSYSGWFWFSKLLYLVGAVTSALLIWQLWDGFDGEINLSGDTQTSEVAEEALDTDGDGREDLKDSDDDNDGFSDIVEKRAGTDPLLASSFPSVDDDGDGYSNETEESEGTDPDDIDDYPELGEDFDGDGFTNEEELEAKSDPTASSSTPESDEDSTETSTTTYTIGAVNSAGESFAPLTNESGSCVDEYVIEEGVTMRVYNVGCDAERSASDFVWSHTSNADGTTLTSTPTSYCVRTGAANDSCSSGNGILEILSTGGDSGVDVEIQSVRGYDQNNAVEGFEPIINSIKVEG